MALFGLINDVKHIKEITGAVFNKYAKHVGDLYYIDFFYNKNIAPHALIPVPKDKNSSEFIEEVLGMRPTTELFISRAEELIPVAVTFNKDKEVERVISGHSSIELKKFKIEKPSGDVVELEIVHNPESVKRAHGVAMNIIGNHSDFRRSKDFREKAIY